MSARIIDWLLKRSMALRGASAPAESTCATYAQYQDSILSGGTRARLLFRVSYEEPTDTTVTLGISPGTGQPIDALFPRFTAIPNTIGASHDPSYEAALGAYWVEWLCGGAVQSALVDLGAGALSLPACDQVTVRFITFFTSPPPPEARFTCQVLPKASPGATATCSRVPVIVGAFPVIYNFRSQWARRWKATISDGQAAFLPPVAVGPVVVDVVDDPGGASLTGEQVTFGSSLAGIGADAAQQGWIETCGFSFAFILHNLGAAPATVKIVEQIQVG